MDRNEDEISEAIEHRDAIIDLRAILATPYGKRFFKYLFKNLEVGELPVIGLEGSLLMDKLGSLRAGRAIFKIVAEADFVTAGQILAEVEKEEYERLLRESGQGTET